MIMDDQEAVPEFPAGHTVLALYPSTTCFYKAIVVRPPSKVQTSASLTLAQARHYFHFFSDSIHLFFLGGARQNRTLVTLRRFTPSNLTTMRAMSGQLLPRWFWICQS